VIRNASLALLIIAALSPAPTRADDSPVALDLTVDDCLSHAEAPMREILNIEIATLAAIDAPTPGTDLGARIHCKGNQVVLTLWHHRTGQVLEQRIMVTDPKAPGIERALALALAELVAVARPPSRRAEPDDEEDDAEEASARRRTHLHMLAVMRAPVAATPWMGGAALELSYDLGRWARLLAGAEWASGAAGTDLGRIRGTSLTGLAAVSVGAFHSRVRLGLDAGLRAGVLRWRGDAEQDDVQAAHAVRPFVGVAGRVAMELPLSDRLHLRTGFEVGAVLAGSRGLAVREDATAADVVGTVAIDRWWAAATVGVTLAL
jgi:hypothetical protein